MCTRYVRRLRALDVNGRRPLLELPLVCRMQKKGAEAEAAPPPRRKGDPPPQQKVVANLFYLGEGTYELDLWSQEMGTLKSSSRRQSR